MKFTVNIAILVGLIILSFFEVHALDSIVSDPLLGMEYDPAKVTFREVGSEENKAMGLREGRWWVFAEYEDAQEGGRYLVVGGLAPHYLDTTPPTPGPLEFVDGLVLQCGKGGCKHLGTVDLITERKPTLDTRIVAGVMDDYVIRLIKALGGKAEVEKVIHAQKLRPWTTPPVAEALVRAGIDAPTWWGEDPGRKEGEGK